MKLLVLETRNFSILLTLLDKITNSKHITKNPSPQTIFTIHLNRFNFPRTTYNFIGSFKLKFNYKKSNSLKKINITKLMNTVILQVKNTWENNTWFKNRQTDLIHHLHVHYKDENFRNITIEKMKTHTSLKNMNLHF